MNTDGTRALARLALWGSVLFLTMREDSGGDNGDTGSEVRDPVCGMQVKTHIALSRVYGGRSYYFCSPSCRDRFRRSPRDYLGGQGEHLEWKGGG